MKVSVIIVIPLLIAQLGLNSGEAFFLYIVKIRSWVPYFILDNFTLYRKLSQAL